MLPEDFSRYVATLGRGPGRSRALTRDEARVSFASVLADEVDPYQVGAFLILLRNRGEEADEVAGLVEAAQARLPPVRASRLIGQVTARAGRAMHRGFYLRLSRWDRRARGY